MLETLRRHSRSVLIYLIFGVLIAAFILTFGPPSGRMHGQGKSGCTSEEDWAARVNGRDVLEDSFRFALLTVTGGQGASGDKARRALIRESVLDELIVREIMAQTAEDLGFRLSDQEVLERIAKNGEVYAAGVPAQRAYFFVQNEGDSAPHFSSEALESFAKRMGLGGVDRLVQEERREFLARKVLELVAAAVRVAPDEILDRYQRDNRKADISYVGFRPSMYRDDVKVTEADIDTYIAANGEELKKEYEQEKELWLNRDPEVRLRDILFKKKVAPPPAASQPASAPAAPPADPAARAQADKARARIVKGEDFAQVARAVSEDERTAKHGGLTEWRREESFQITAPELRAALPNMKKGDVSQVVDSPDGYHIYQLVERRAGDVPEGAVLRELAERKVLEEKSSALARAEADKALAAVKAGTPLDKLFGAEATGGKPNLVQQPGVTREGEGVPGVGKQPQLVKALFEDLAPAQVAPQVYETERGFFLVRLDKRSEPDMQKFQEEKPRLAQGMAAQRAGAVIGAYQERRCREVRDQGGIRFDRAYVTYSDSKGQASSLYSPCMTFSPIVRAAQAGQGRMGGASLE
jgi:peptidyl-prolyl cis-trans isomerase D